MRDLVVPGKLVRNYLDGLRIRYIHPLRLLLLSSLLYFGAAAALEEDTILLNRGDREGVFVQVTEDDSFETRFLEDADSGELDRFWETTDWEAILDTDDPGQARAHLAAARTRLNSASGQRLDEADRTTAVQVLDSAAAGLARAALPVGYLLGDDEGLSSRLRGLDRQRARQLAHERAGALVDSLRRDRAAGRIVVDEGVLDTIALAFPAEEGTFMPDALLFGERHGLTTRELLALSPAQLASATDAEHWVNRLIVAKWASLLNDGVDSLYDYFSARFSWVVLLFVPLRALGYFGLYFRRLPYYTQHLTHVAVGASVGLLLLIVPTILRGWGLATENGIAFGMSVFAWCVYTVLSDLRVYETAWWKVLLKQGVLVLWSVLALAVATVLFFFIAVLLR